MNSSNEDHDDDATDMCDDMFSSVTDDRLTTDMFCGSISAISCSADEPLNKEKALAQQLLDLLSDDVKNVGLMQHLRAFVSGMILPPAHKQKKNKRKKVNNRQLRAQSLKKLFVSCSQFACSLVSLLLPD